MLPVKELLTQAQSLYDEQKYDEVITLLTDDVLETHNDTQLYSEKGRAFIAKKDYDKAITPFTKAIAADPKYAYPYSSLGNVYFNLKKHDKAIEYYNEAIKIDPNSSYANYGLGLVYYDLKDYEKAIEYYNQAIKIDPNFSYSSYGAGLAYYDLRNYDKAIEYYNQAIKIDPDSYYPYYGLGLIYNESKNYDKAIEYYDKAVKANVNYSDAYNRLGNVYSDLKDYEQAIKNYDEAIRTDASIVHPYNGLGNVYSDLKDYVKSLSFYDKAIQMDTAYKYAYFGRGLVYQNTEEYKKALADYDKYIELTQSNPDYYTSLARERIVELEKLIDSPDYSKISEIVNKIKRLLLFKDQWVTHYTGLSVTKILILNENSLFRLSEGAYLNDTSEGRELFDFLPAFFKPSGKVNNAEAKPFVPKPFIGSFVSKTLHDDLTLWRMYGKENKEEARGCAITIEREKLLENLKNSLIPDVKINTPEKIDEEINFYRVAYRKQDNKDHFIIPGSPDEEETLNKLMTKLLHIVNSFVKKKNDLKVIQNVVELLNRIAYLFKSFEYQYEQELRLVVKGIGFDKNVDTTSDPPRVYINLVSVRPLITRVTLGPKVEKADECAAAFYYSLDKQDLHPEILISHLPFK